MGPGSRVWVMRVRVRVLIFKSIQTRTYRANPWPQNQFDKLDAYFNLPPKKSRLRDELDRYLSTDLEATKDTIKCRFVTVERVFSRGRILLSHIRSGSLLGLVHDEDLCAVAVLSEGDPKLGNEDGDIEMEAGWDAI
ncbi:hypothetical protein K435DRAFT_788946 [Dendrothele bispora CBS 962.96]|uniref:Uncharacterized protein n=1 Tax=Dendrothele bispora (strain CBS 962.96) TaxID=1314807 RepID=A0A4S8MWT9_DENBC|nr:hypothetical protein K435DRAFT_788946 [Dendrothele bispora CBS 962.96]